MNKDDLNEFLKKGLICIAIALGVGVICVLGSLLSAWVVNTF